MGFESFWMFDFFGTVFPAVFVVILGIIALTLGKELLAWGRNNKQPVLTVSSRITGRRIQVSQQSQSEGQNTRTLYFITFEVDSGDRIEFKVGGDEYGLCSEGDEGQLTFQGTRYLGFKRYNRVYTERVRG
ncbi:DUF2500 domain-containing protein [Paenibacillus shunpengii]|uniref:DUF2500 domain-containing protein n=1 Tax=Paenibacillus shunpengii TaxID=2054424 RepID=A0ABW5SQA4_9BACL|nr:MULTISPECIES: DUF2500 domain-containing protein [unclassified Paenibacillus]OMC68367.1 hypothetical protein BK126_11020 [Paenibacillus sp. FSL H7-0326]SDW63641.1 Protein of unknown function [Paenibacillus sp. PDC88]